MDIQPGQLEPQGKRKAVHIAPTAQTSYFEMNGLIEKAREVPGLIERFQQAQTDFVALSPDHISPNPLQSNRFVPNNERKILMQFCPSAAKLVNSLVDNLNKGVVNTYIKGPVGVGKSYALLNALVDCRQPSSRTRVLYINNPLEWIANWVPYIVKEIAFTIGMYIDEMENQDAKRCFEFNENESFAKQFFAHTLSLITQNNSAEKAFPTIKNILVSYMTYCHAQKRSFIVFCDQYTYFDLEKEKTKESRISLAREMLDFFPQRVYTMSTMTMERPSSMQDGSTLYLNQRFDLISALKFVLNKKGESPPLKIPIPKYKGLTATEEVIYILDDVELVSPKPESHESKYLVTEDDLDETFWDQYPDLKRIYDITEFYPYELEVLMSIARDDLKHNNWQEVFDAYLIKRGTDITSKHKSWLQELSTTERKRFYKLIGNLYLNIALSLEDRIGPVFDPNHMYLEAETCQFANKVIEERLWSYYSNNDDFWNFINEASLSYLDIFSKCFNHPTLSSSAKGGILERALELLLRTISKRNKTLKISCLNHTQIWEEREIGTIKKIRSFKSCFELIEKLQSSLNSQDKDIELFIPDSQIFGKSDFIILNPAQQSKLFLLQVTKNIASHKPSDKSLKHELQSLKTSKEMKALNFYLKELEKYPKKIQPSQAPAVINAILKSPQFTCLKQDLTEKYENIKTLGQLETLARSIKKQTNAQDISIAICYVFENKAFDFEFIWVGDAYDSQSHKKLEISDICKKIDKESYVALIGRPNNTFNSLLDLVK